MTIVKRCAAGANARFRSATPLVTLATASAIGLLPTALSALQQTRIDQVMCGARPCPNPIELASDQPLTVNLRGQRLGQIRSGSAILRGSPNQAVTITLARATNRGARRNATLTATGSSNPIQGLELQFSLETGTVTAPRQVSVGAQQSRLPGQTAGTSPPGPASRPGAPSAPPSVTGASSAIIDLEPGSSKTVELQGVNLDALQGARLTLAGRQVGNLTATLLPSSESSQRSVTLTAPSEPTPPWNQPLELEVYGQVAGALPSPVQVRLVLPDLVVESVEVDDDNVNRRIEVKVGNVGLADAVVPAGVVLFRVDRGPLAALPYASASQLRIKPNSYEQTWVGVPEGPTADNQLWTVRLDPFSLVKESQTSNNSAGVAIGPGLLNLNTGLSIISIATDPPEPTGPYELVVRLRTDRASQSPKPIQLDGRADGGAQCVAPMPVTYVLPAVGDVGDFRFDPQGEFGLPGDHTCTFGTHYTGESTLQGPVDYSWSVGGSMAPANPRIATVVLDRQDNAREPGTSSSASSPDGSGSDWLLSNGSYVVRVAITNDGPGTLVASESSPITVSARACMGGDVQLRQRLNPGRAVFVWLEPLPPYRIAGTHTCRFRIDYEDDADPSPRSNEVTFTWTVHPSEH